MSEDQRLNPNCEAAWQVYINERFRNTYYEYPSDVEKAAFVAGWDAALLALIDPEAPGY